MQIRPSSLRVDVDALASNVAYVRALTGNRGVCAVVKGNAYGLGLIPVSQAFAKMPVDYLGVALVEEGVALREAGITCPILVLGNAFDGGYREIVAFDLTPVVSRPDQIDALRPHAQKCPVPIHLKIDTGMNRLGTAPRHLGRMFETLADAPHVKVMGWMTHLANATDRDESTTRGQMDCFEECCRTLVEKGFSRPPWIHAANSAAMLSWPWTHGSMVRPGLALYGIEPRSPPGDTRLQLAAQLVSRPIHFNDVPPGAAVSYGGRWVAQRPTRLATLPIGYADGYAYGMSGSAEVLVRGRRAKVVGSICMDMCMIDVTDIDGVSFDDEVVLMGSQGNDRIGPDELARWGQTHVWDVLCRLSNRLPRTHHTRDK